MKRKERKRQEEINKKQRWIEVISNYVRGELKDEGDDDDIAFDYDSDWDGDWPSETRDNEHLLNVVRHNGQFKLPSIPKWNIHVRTEKKIQVSSMAFYEKFLEIHQTDSDFGYYKCEASITDIHDTKGKTLHVSLTALNFDYSDVTNQAIVTLKDCYKKYYKVVEPKVLYCNPKEKIGIQIYDVFREDRDTADSICGEKRATNMTLSMDIVPKLAYLYDTVRPLLSYKLGDAINYFNYIDVKKLDKKAIKVTLYLGDGIGNWDHYWTETFKLEENFESNFNAWWKLTLLDQVKWLKSEVARLSADAREESC